jgi:hypothetical protein
MSAYDQVNLIQEKRGVIAHLRFDGAVIKQVSVEPDRWKVIIRTRQYPLPLATSKFEAELLNYYDLIFECRGERVYPDSPLLDFYFDFVGVTPFIMISKEKQEEVEQG